MQLYKVATCDASAASARQCVAVLALQLPLEGLRVTIRHCSVTINYIEIDRARELFSYPPEAD
jgi:hypothetical protein